MSINFSALLDQDRRAVRASVAAADQLDPADLGKRTPCSAWNLGQLLEHMTVQHHGFAAAAAGNGSDPGVWGSRPTGADAVTGYAEAAERVLAAFAEDGVAERDFALPELSTQATFPATLAIGIHLVDYLVHGWDVAATLGFAFTPDTDVVEAALAIAEQVPDDASRRAPGAAFAPALATHGDAAPLERTLRLLGRDPRWPG